MGWTKRQIVEQAFEELGMAAYAYDITPDQMQAALRRLDMMMALWSAKGIKLFYPLPTSPENSDLDDDAGVPDLAIDAICANLALRMAPSYGKSVGMETRQVAKASYDWLLNVAAMPEEMAFPRTLPLGAGNRSEAAYVVPTEDNNLTGPTNEVDFL